eukprot:m.9862 g.9862  ORF g.9862 m.9862 type:complete len:372 (-) comp9511_c0_seq1:166-1281(-)
MAQETDHALLHPQQVRWEEQSSRVPMITQTPRKVSKSDISLIVNALTTGDNQSPEHENAFSQFWAARSQDKKRAQTTSPLRTRRRTRASLRRAASVEQLQEVLAKLRQEGTHESPPETRVLRTSSPPLPSPCADTHVQAANDFVDDDELDLLLSQPGVQALLTQIEQRNTSPTSLNRSLAACHSNLAQKSVGVSTAQQLGPTLTTLSHGQPKQCASHSKPSLNPAGLGSKPRAASPVKQLHAKPALGTCHPPHNASATTPAVTPAPTSSKPAGSVTRRRSAALRDTTLQHCNTDRTPNTAKRKSTSAASATAIKPKTHCSRPSGTRCSKEEIARKRQAAEARRTKARIAKNRQQALLRKQEAQRRRQKGGE